jgi:two-component sensor histidine kinase
MLNTWNEADRLAALREYQILDSASVSEFDDFVQIAAQVCEAPIAVVNLIDQARQWFAAEIGLGVRQTPLDVSICAHAILQPGVFVVPDLTQDRRFECNPLVTGHPGLRFYGGALLEAPGGLPLGTICVLDYKPRPNGLTDRQEFTLRALARQVMVQLELRRAVAERQAAVAEKELLILEAHHRVKNSLQMVQNLLRHKANTTLQKEASAALRQSASMLASFAAMHTHLYQPGAELQVNLQDYLGRLVGEQREASDLGGREIRFRSDVVTWPTYDAPSVALVMMELVTNAAKYGEGAIDVTLEHAAHGIVLIVEDEGTGLSNDFRPSQSKGLGMRVIRSLVEARKGRLTIDRTRGHTCFAATLKAPSYPPLSSSD